MNHTACIREVGLRDGLQSIAQVMSTPKKVEWIDRAVKCGISEIEVTSFVPPAYLPQFSDASEIMRHAVTVSGLVASALTPNLKGAEHAMAAGAQHLIFIITASESFSQANLRRPIKASIDEFESLCQRLKSARENEDGGGTINLTAAISSAFGCSLEGEVPQNRVVSMVESLLETGAKEILLADTVGYATPLQTAELSRLVYPLCKQANARLGLHFHDTRGLGLANVLAALEQDVCCFDASLGGIGGCPNAPGATGNIATEDLAFMLESMGLQSGIDIDALIQLREWLEHQLPAEHLHGHLHAAGLPKGVGIPTTS